MNKSKVQPLYLIIFEDGSHFIGGNLIETKWLDIPSNKLIKRIFYTLPSGDKLVLEGYDSYYHMCEATMDINGSRRGDKSLEFDYIIGRKGNKARVYKLDLITGNIEKLEYNMGDKFIKKLNINGWK